MYGSRPRGPRRDRRAGTVEPTLPRAAAGARRQRRGRGRHPRRRTGAVGGGWGWVGRAGSDAGAPPGGMYGTADDVCRRR